MNSSIESRFPSGKFVLGAAATGPFCSFAVTLRRQTVGRCCSSRSALVVYERRNGAGICAIFHVPMASDLTQHSEADDGTPELSAVILCYRAGQGILRVVGPLHEQLREAGITFELVLVANYWPGKEDVTPEIVTEFAREHEHVHTLTHPKEGGMGWDMRNGLAAAQGRYAVVIDGDAQNPVDDVLRMYRLMTTTGYDVMKGRRIARFDGLYRRVVSGVYNLLFRLLFRTKGIWDINGKPKGLRREAYERMNLMSNDWFVDAEIVLAARKLGIAVGEMPVTFLESERSSFVRASAIVEFLANMASFRLRGRPKG
jgi:glycosyl transferase family 2